MVTFKSRPYGVFFVVCILVTSAMGCTEDENSPDDIMDIAMAAPAEMSEEGVVQIGLGTVQDDFIQVGNPMAAVNASLKIVLSNSDVADLLDLQNLPTSSLLNPSQTCFQVSVAGLSVVFDFDGCSTYGLSGKIKVAKKFTGLLAGPTTVSFEDGFTMKNVAISGTLGLGRIAGTQLKFNAFTADKDGDRGTPITVEYLDQDITVETRFNGKVKLALQSAELLFWGIASSTVKGVTSTIYLGGISEDEVSGNMVPADAIAYKLLPFNCYCPNRGVISGNLTLKISNVQFDLDDFTEDNGTDDYPAFDVPVTVDGSYTATVTFSECGLMQVQLHVEDETPIDFSVALGAILSGLESAHNQGLIPDDIFTEMSTIIANAQTKAPSFQITVGELVNKVSGMLNQQLYVPFCAVN